MWLPSTEGSATAGWRQGRHSTKEGHVKGPSDWVTHSNAAPRTSASGSTDTHRQAALFPDSQCLQPTQEEQSPQDCLLLQPRQHFLCAASLVPIC